MQKEKKSCMNYSIPDAFCEEIKLIVPVKTSRVGRPETDARPRQCMDAIFWILKTGAQWSSIPEQWRSTQRFTENLESGLKPGYSSRSWQRQERFTKTITWMGCVVCS